MLRTQELKGEPFVIAEVGQNHQGNLEYAREYIRVLAFCGADAVKFQTRNNEYLFASDAYNSEYRSENAFASTYGEHREVLELKPEWLQILKQDCVKHGVKFISTPFDEPSLMLLQELDVDIIKIASFDIGNLPFIDRIGKTKKPVVLSIGGGTFDHIRSSVETLQKYHDDIVIMHCVSEYPCEYNRLGLDNIQALVKQYPELLIGSSDHFNGILSGPIAYMKGARIFEKHVTLNRAWKGTDHSFALEPEGFRKFVRDVKRVRHMMEPKPENEVGTETVFLKLGKSIVPSDDIKKGEKITIDKLSGRIFKKNYIPVRDSIKVIGKISKREIPKGNPILLEDLME